MKKFIKKVPEVPVFLAGILWGCIGLFIRILNSAGLESMEIVVIRAAVSAVLMFLFLGLFNRGLLRIKIRDLWCFLGTGIGSLVFFNFCYFKTIETSSMAVAAVLLYTAPAMVLVMSTILFKEKLTGLKVVSIVITFLGCVLVTGINTVGSAMTPKAILIGLGAGFGYALYSIFGRYALNRGYHTFTITAYTFLFAVIGSACFVDLKKVSRIMITDSKALAFAIMLGVFSTVIPYLAYTLGLKYMANSKASVLATVEPVTAALVGLVVFHEVMSVGMIAGIVFVILGVVIAGIKTEDGKDA